MNTIESVVTQIQGLSGSVTDIGALHTCLKQADDLLHTESTRLLPFLDQLDPSIHSLGYLYILYLLILCSILYFLFFFVIFIL